MVDKLTNRQKKFFDKTVSMFRDAGCPTLETEYKPAKERWKFVCDCGEVKEILPHDFKRGRRCRDCAVKSQRESMRTPVKDVENYFNNTADILVRVHLKDSRTVVDYLCAKGHENSKPFHSYKSGHMCAKCAQIDAGNRYRFRVQEVSEIFAEQGCELLETEYTNSNQKLRYRCSCGNISYSYISAIRKGIKCGCQYPRGEDHPLWNEYLTEEQRALSRNYPEYRTWVSDVFERDDYTCQKCLSRGGKLNAHHILSYADHVELRTELSNGVTLCASCHRDFHNTFGYSGFSKQDLDEFLATPINTEETIICRKH